MSLHDARRYMSASAPRTPQAHLIESALGLHLFVADGSRLFDAEAELFRRCGAAMARGDSEEIEDLLRQAGLDGPPMIDDAPLPPPKIRALSLAIAQKCNLGCAYCYAQQGDFGAPAKNMSLADALSAVELLVGEAERGERLNLAFLGGEPLVNRPTLRAAARRARELAETRRAIINYSITTNGTLLTEDDARFFEEFGFAVTISLDGPREVHDALRPYKGGAGSFDAVMRRAAPLLRMQRRMQVSARVTVTPTNLALRRTLDTFVAAGFHSVGFSPMLSSPAGQGELQSDDLELMLGEMIDCGREYERRSRLGERYPFANMVNAMREIHRGTHRPYPCGAGAGYLGVSADGELSACHRFVGDEDGAMGSLAEGVDRTRQAQWLAERHVHRQEPCRSCWARYLCGGGCHHEVLRRGRPACDYIRGWLHYCLEAYLRLSPQPAGNALDSIGTSYG
ncbi:MAG: SPASM domain-containing protein [Hyphomicrobiales bacterium]|nr:SPASM domain-containing protein [Hyphomicrobiales bacterium]